jgi:purine nucleosidase
MQHVWIDTDLGFDDLAAVLTMTQSADWVVDGMSLVAGNAPIEVVIGNALRSAALFGWNFPIHVGAASPLVGELVTAQSVLGEDAMDSAGRSLPADRAVAASDDAIGALVEYLDGVAASAADNRQGERVVVPSTQAGAAATPASGAAPVLSGERAGATILALGPLTNIALALQRRPDLAGRIGRLMWMGGSAGPGNHTAAAEFNAAVDPEAINVVLDAGVALHMVGLDACRQVKVHAADAADLRALGTDKAELLADLLLGYVRIASKDGSLPMSLYDPTAAAALVSPASLTFEPAHMVAECTGRHTRGMTVVEWRVPRKAQPNTMVATVADEAEVRRVVLGALASAASA